ncbi:PD-(D/E)XK nuclease superfamily protein [Planctomycetes bacterium Pla163]|uniref:PD-(D/E)XK nuclease superfamily protein n=1 Tax=Rohdeia mirabilis TaxID=2528008 RepID=A0A518CYI3_9BACT|nr:PD-(D/E)XK nuclease superfamily protein [Planctomycetes bacterium Pla163]
MPSDSAHRPPLAFASPRALEDWLRERLDERDAPLTQRVRVLVRGGAARVHLAGRLVRGASNGALLGVRVGTVLGAALERVHRADADGAADGSSEMSELAAELELRRGVLAAAPLADALAGLDDGEAVGRRAVHELVAAGLVRDQIDGLLELCDEHPTPRVVARARALVELAARAAPGGDLAAGADAIFASAAHATAPSSALEDETLFVVCAEAARGGEADFVEALRRAGAQLLFVAGADGPLARRLSSIESADTTCEPTALAWHRAPDLRAALRSAVRTVDARHRSGVAPEDLGLCVPDPGALAGPLARAFDELGVPFSATGNGAPPRGPGRRLAALAQLLGSSADVEAATIACACGDGRRGALVRRIVERGEALATIGVDPAPRAPEPGGADEAPAFDGFLPFAASEDHADEHPATSPDLSDDPSLGAARTLSDAARFVATLDDAERSAADFAHALRALVTGSMGWTDTDDATATLVFELSALTSSGIETATGAEWAALLRPRLERAALAPLGGRGAGVQVVTPDGARGRAFDTLVLVGFDRGAFPRAASADPLLDDELRRELRALVPDLETAADRRTADEALLAQLLDGGSAVHVIHAAIGADGTARLLAPGLERRLAARGLEPQDAPEAGSPQDAQRGPLPPLEWARLAGAVHSGADGAAANDAARAFERTLGALHASPAAASAHAASVLGHDDRGADLGALGRVLARANANESEPFLTRLERHALCGWAAHLERDLRLEPSADGEPVTPDARLVGTVVHGALEVLLTAGHTLGDHEGELGTWPSVSVARPDADALEAALDRGIAEALSEAERKGRFPTRSRGAAAWLRARCRPLVQNGIDALWTDATVDVIALEVERRLEVAREVGEAVAVRFRADAVLGSEAGTLLVDFKTGAPKKPTPKPPTRTKHLVADLLRGERLQAGAYAAASGGRGAYLFLGGEDAQEDERFTEVDAATARPALERSLPVLVDTRRAGLALPRLVDADTSEDKLPTACERCALIDACVQGDTGWRERQRRWIERVRQDGTTDVPEALAAAWFDLFVKEADA